MEKKMLRFIPKPVTFQNQPNFSPNKFKAHVAKGYSGQIIHRRTSEEEEEEPTSPKISCMGQIKHRHRQRRNNKKIVEAPKTKLLSPLRGFFGKPQEKRSGAPRPQNKVPERAPNVGQMRRFASGRDTLAGFDWRVHGATVGAKQRNSYSNEDSDEEEEIIIPFSAPIMIGELGVYKKEDLELKPRKEINLWKRRTMAQPRRLQVAPLR